MRQTLTFSTTKPSLDSHTPSALNINPSYADCTNEASEDCDGGEESGRVGFADGVGVSSDGGFKKGLVRQSKESGRG